MKFGGLRIEKTKSLSGKIFRMKYIPVLKETNYYVRNIPLSGDAPKQMISAYFYERDGYARKSSVKTWKQFICKTAEKWYPIESVTEYMINKIGKELGLKMNKFRIVSVKGQIRFLSEYFLSEDEKLIHAAEICGEYIDDLDMAKEIAENRNDSKSLFTHEFITKAIQDVFPDQFDDINESLVKVIAFDAIVGNNDRHFYNWGVITHLKKSNKNVVFAPIYDSARGLLWNIPDKNLLQYIESEKKLHKYLNSSLPRISFEENKAPNHFDLIEFIVNKSDKNRSIVRALVAYEKELHVFKMLENDCFHFLTEKRKELIKLILLKRFEKIREICGQQ